MKVLYLFLLSASVLADKSPEEIKAPKCGKNEVYSNCGTACPKTCDNKDAAIACTAQCVKGCFCKDKYVRNAQGVCVLTEECPPKETCADPNAVFQECHSACQPTCDNLHDTDKVCTQQCVRGCVCKKGYILETKSGKCVLIEKCLKQECGPNQVYKTCGTACPQTCKNKDEPITCTAQCVKGCFCIEGYVLNENGVCIPGNKCATPPTCADPNAEFKACGTACPDSCSNYKQPNRVCTKQCVSECQCKKGYVFDDPNSSNRKCILPKHCPISSCPENEVFKKCRILCPPQTCESLVALYKCAAPQPCEPGCDCISGYLRDKTGTCINSTRCFPDTPTCPENEEYVDCVAGECKPKHCADLGQSLPCPRLKPPCAGGCLCVEGYLRNDEGLCIPQKQCPQPQCPANEEYNFCTPALCRAQKCSDLDKPIVCADVTPSCNEGGCVCKEGYLRNDDNVCIPQKSCPNLLCKTNETVYGCAIECPTNNCPTDDGPQPLCLPPYPCKPGCGCKVNYRRNKNKHCILASECPPIKCTRPNEIFDSCPHFARFLESCDVVNDPPTPTTKTVICNPRCVCKKGYFRNSNDICILAKNCPGNIKCKTNEVATDCLVRDNCGQQCSDIGKTLNCPLVPSDCNQPGCVCASGYYRNNKGICVSEEQCPEGCNEDPNARPGCGFCGQRCSQRDQKNVACPASCQVNGCSCKEGYLYDDKLKRCVRPEDCTC